MPPQTDHPPTHRGGPWIPAALVLGATACGTPAPPPCQDPACRQAAVLAAFAADPNQGMQQVAALPNPIEAVAAVDAVAEQDVHALLNRCDALAGPAAERCKHYASRAHLWADAQPADAPPTPGAHGTRPAPGPPGTKLYLTQVVESRLANSPVQAVDCPAPATPTACATEAATLAGRDLDGATAAGLCRSIEDTLWRDECFFVAGLAAAETGNRKGQTTSAELCIAAGQFQRHCLRHAVTELAKHAPAISTNDARTWRRTLDIEESIGQTWARRDPSFGAWQQDRFWAFAMANSFMRSRELSGDAVPLLPQRALPHARAAAAWMVLERANPPIADLAEAIDRVQQAIAHRTPQLRQSSPPSHWPTERVGAWWPTDVAGSADAHRTAHFYLGTSRRAAGEDERADIAVCVVEAAARMGERGKPLLAQARSDVSETVRWTVGRLGG